MAGKDISFKVSAKDDASGTLNKVAGTVNSFSKETKEALKPLDNLNKSFSSITKAFTPLTVGITAAVAGLKKLSDAISVCTDEWAKDELAMKRIDFAGTINNQLAGTTQELKDLANSIEEMTHGWVGAGDVMDSMSSMLYDKTTPQIKEIILAATDLSAAMGTDLNSAVTQLNNLLAGTTGTLGKMFPELKTFSKEQHEAGDSVAYVAEKVKGAATAFSNTTEGIKREAEESKNALKSAFGDFFTELTVPMTKFFSNIRQQIAGIINNINETRRAIKQLENDDLRVQLEGAQTLWDKAVAERDAARTLVENYAAVNRSSVQATASANGMSFDAVVKNLVETNAAWKSANEDVIKYSALTVELQKQVRDSMAESGSITVNLTDTTIEDLSTETSSNISSEVSKGIVKGFANPQLNNASSAWLSQQQYGGVTSMSLNLPELTGSFNTEDFFSGLQLELGDAATTLFSGGTTSYFGDFVEKIKDVTKELGQGFKTALQEVISSLGDSSGWIGVLVEALMNLENVVSIIGWWLTIIRGFIEEIGPVINEVLQPVVNALLQIGKLVGQALTPSVKALIPVIEVLAEVFTWLYNKILIPIGNAIMVFFTIIGNIGIAVANLFIDIYNLFAWILGKSQKDKKNYLDPNDYMLQEIDTEDILGSDYGSSSSSTGTTLGASYTAQRDITVNISYSHSFVNGDAQQIAIQIKKELESVNALGY